MSITRTLHVDDVVAFKNGESMESVGYVDRTHGDVESHEPLPAGAYGMKIHRSKLLSRVAFKQFMKDGVPPKGFVLVQWQTHPKTEIVAEKELELLDRTFLAGDIVRRDGQVSDAMAGTVVSVRRKCTLLGMCEAKELKSGKSLRAAWLPSPIGDESPLLELVHDGQVLNGIPATELQFVHQYNEGDLVIYKNWMGRIRECFDEITVRLSDNGVVTIKDELDLEPLNGDPSERLSVGSLIKTKKGCLRTGIWRYGAYSPNVTPIGVVVDVRTQECQVDWMQSKLGGPNTSLEGRPLNAMPEAIITLDELESGNVVVYDLSRRPLDDVPISTKISSDLELQGGLRVRFKDSAGASVKYDGTTPHGKFDRLDRKESLGYDMNVFTVTNTATQVDIQWNDLSMTTEPAISLIPDFATDDEDAVFPGEIVCTNDYIVDGAEGTIKSKKVGVVQTVNTTDRIAHVKWCAGGHLAFLETTYTTAVPASWKGSLLDVSEEVSFYDVKAPESINRRRGDFVLIPEITFQALGITFESESIHWLGEIVDVTADGHCVIRLGASQPVREVSLPTEITILAFRGADLDDMGGADSDVDDAMSVGSRSDDLDEIDLDDEDLEMYDDDDDDAGQWFVAGQPGMAVDEDDDSWSTASEDDDDELTETTSTSLPTIETSKADEVPSVRSETENTHAVSNEPQDETSSASIEEMNLSSFLNAPPAYDIVDTAVPTNHPFAHRIAATSSGHMKAVQKEHKILRTSSTLPSGIYVRTWESRLDLIRVLFVGPIGTPYEYAPFIVDLFLGPGFPAEAPSAHFHSWTSEGTGMQGRVNPNLYEDGKICLSLLGTWQGDDSKGEGWVAGKSTVLQVLVSILGLVLVKEPYYNEAGYEALQGLSSSRHSSSVYTERTYLRARAFLITSLGPLHGTRPTSPSSSSPVPQGAETYEDVLRWLYFSTSGPRLLQKAIEACKAILQASESIAHDKDGLTAVSKGASLLLTRVVDKLEEIEKTAGQV